MRGTPQVDSENSNCAAISAIPELLFYNCIESSLSCQLSYFTELDASYIRLVFFKHFSYKPKCFAMKLAHCCVVMSDGNHLLVDRRSYRLFTSGQPGTVPCRPTHPNVTVTLMKSAEVVALSDNVAFDRHAGFLVRNASSYFGGYFKCSASLDDVTSQQTVIITHKGQSTFTFSFLLAMLLLLLRPLLLLWY